MIDKSEIISDICAEISNNRISNARQLVQDKYPFEFHEKAKRSKSKIEMFKIFQRDHFIDQYSGDRLVFPPSLRVINVVLQKNFPFQSHGKMTDCHIAFWELLPSLDHVIPIARGGKDEDDNIVTTSMLRNNAKMNWTLDELGWKRISKIKGPNWDGMVEWYIKYYENHENLRPIKYFTTWYGVAKNHR